jgi:hypothetical protein
MTEKQYNMDTPYTRDELVTLLNKVEDYLLDARNIRVPTSRYNMILQELINFKYNRKMFSLASIWLKKGKFPVSKTTLELSDFFPDKKMLEQFTDDIVSREYHIRTINSIKTDFQIEKKKLEIEYFEKYSTPDIIHYETEYRTLLMQSTERTMLDSMKIDALNKQVKQLQSEVVYLQNRLDKKNSMNIDESSSLA